MKYNIEYSHIYADEVFNDEHIKGSEILDELVKKHPYKDDFVVTTLIDEYTPKKNDIKLNFNNFLAELSKNGLGPDFVGYESRLVDLSEKTLGYLDDTLRKKYYRYIKNKGKHPCSLLATTWYLLRLGVLEQSLSGLKIVEPLKNRNINEFCGQKLITILPVRFKEIEQRIIYNFRKSEKIRDLVNKIELIFF